MRIDARTDKEAKNYEAYYDGLRAIGAVAADTDEGWVEVYVELPYAAGPHKMLATLKGEVVLRNKLTGEWIPSAPARVSEESLSLSANIL